VALRGFYQEIANRPSRLSGTFGLKAVFAGGDVTWKSKTKRVMAVLFAALMLGVLIGAIAAGRLRVRLH